MALLLLVLSLGGCMTMDMDMGGGGAASMGVRHATSENGMFRVTVQSEVDQISMNTIHAWTIHVETDSGRPVNNAEITINGGMPAHGHGLPTEPQVTANLGNGDYRVEGMKFHMQGHWVVTFSIAADGKKDTATIELQL